MRILLILLFAVPFLGLQANANTQPPTREWTFLIYLNGHNNLDAYGAKDINEMEQVGSNANVAVVVQWASLANGATKRLLVQKDNDTNNVTSPVVDQPGKVDMGDWRSIVEFVRWGVAKYPAKHYFINVWDHGSGWHLTKTAMDAGMTPKDISWDDNTNNYIKTEQLGQAMGEAAKIIGHKVDIYGSDACLMGMAEVADEMSEHVEYFVGSEEVEPLAGWPYDALLRYWAAGPRTAEEVSKSLVDAYVKSYQGGTQGTEEVALSAFNLGQMGQFNSAVVALGKELGKLDKAGRSQVMRGAEATQRFAYSDYADVADFIDQIDKANVRGIDRGVITGMNQAVDRFVIANAATSNYAKAKGVAFWLPTSQSSYNWYKDRYKGMRFNAHTDWGLTLSNLLQDETGLLF